MSQSKLDVAQVQKTTLERQSQPGMLWHHGTPWHHGENRIICIPAPNCVRQVITLCKTLRLARQSELIEGMNVSVSRQLARTAEFTGKTLGKADVSDPGLLQTALLMCNLSNAVYAPDELMHWESDVVRQALCAVSQQISSFKPHLEHSHTASDTGPFKDSGRQYGIWDVKGLGVVAAFGGTQDPIDILTDLNFETHQLTAGSFNLHLHGGIYQAAKHCCADIASQCIKLCRKPDGEVLPLFLTGVLFAY